MSGNLSDIVEKSIGANKTILETGRQKEKNLETKEFNIKRKFKKGMIYGSIISALLLCSYGGCKVLRAYNYAHANGEAKIVYYQNRFDQVKRYYKIGNYVKADELSENLQDDMGKESFFSPTKPLYKEVKKYDDEFIDSEIRRIKREKFYQYWKGLPHNISYRLREKWDNIPPGGRFIIYACGVGLIIYLLRRRY